jgi:DNA-binding NarL/FixJ family response regulator
LESEESWDQAEFYDSYYEMRGTKLTPYTVVLADDHEMFRGGIKKIISEIDDLEVIGEAKDGIELLELLKKNPPQLIVLDISMPRLRGLEAAREIKRLLPQVKILFLTMHKKEEFIRESLESGADGFLLKESAVSELVQAIQTIRAGKKFISPLISSELTDMALRKGPGETLTLREKQVLKLLAEGKDGKEIAKLLYISLYTVRRHRDNIARKLKLKNMAELIRYAIDRGYAANNS